MIRGDVLHDAKMFPQLNFSQKQQILKPQTEWQKKILTEKEPKLLKNIPGVLELSSP